MNSSAFPVSRGVFLSFSIDTNRINAKARIPAMNRLEKWHHDEVIQMEISKAAHEECTVGDSDLAKKRAEKASGHIIALTNKDPVEQHPEVLKKLMRAMDADEHAGDLWAKIEKILFPGGIKTDNQRNDVRIVYSAAHYGTILVTDEDASKSQSGGILGNKHRLKELRIDVMTGDEAVELVRAQIAYRDSQTMLAHKNMRLPLPEWVGND